MSLNFTNVPSDVAETLQKNAGILLTEFDPSETIDEEYKQAMREKIILATDGGIEFKDEIEWADGAEGIDNMPEGTAEMMEEDTRKISISGTGKTAGPLAMPYLATLTDATKVGGDDSKHTVYTPRDVVKMEDFKALWYVCDYGNKGGFIAIKMEKVLNEDGFSLKTNNKDKGEFAFNFVAHYSIADISKVPYEIHVVTEA